MNNGSESQFQSVLVFLLKLISSIIIIFLTTIILIKILCWFGNVCDWKFQKLVEAIAYFLGYILISGVILKFRHKNVLLTIIGIAFGILFGYSLTAIWKEILTFEYFKNINIYFLMPPEFLLIRIVLFLNMVFLIVFFILVILNCSYYDEFLFLNKYIGILIGIFNPILLYFMVLKGNWFIWLHSIGYIMFFVYLSIYANNFRISNKVTSIKN